MTAFYRNFLFGGLFSCCALMACNRLPSNQQSKGGLMPVDQQKGIAAVLDAKNAEQERDAVARLVEQLRESNTEFDIVLKSINDTTDLTIQEYLRLPNGVVVVRIGDAVYLWDPVDRVNIDIFRTE